MENEEGIGLVLARATELRLKICDCIENASYTATAVGDNYGSGGSSPVEGREDGSLVNGEKNYDVGEMDEEDEEAKRLFHIRDGLESLESQLASLQNLWLRQKYEKQMALSEIDHSRKMLLEKIKGYKGKDIEVIRETSAFAGESVDYNNDLLLPPYPIHLPVSLVSDNGHLPLGIPTKQKPESNDPVSGDSNEKNSYRESENSSKWVLRFVSSVAKIALPIVGVISILSVYGYSPEMRRNGKSLKFLGFLKPQADREERSSVQCPPGKVIVKENGKVNCVVKERVEIPFDSSVDAKRDVTYGYG